MTIEIDTGVVGNRADNTTYQHVPTTNPASWHTVNAAAGQWQKWNDGAGDTTGNPLISLSAVATAHSGCNVVRAYLRLGLGDSYHGTGSGTVGWVDKVTISTMTYDFVVAPATNSATGSGTVTLNADGGTFEDVAAVAESALPTTGKPSLTFPNGFFSFNIFGLTPGDTVTVTLTMPSAIPVGTQYWKYGPTSSNPGGEWYQITMGDDDGDNVITIPLTDGGLGDDDLTANGVIVDQGGPGSPPVPTPTPTPAPAKVGGTGLFPPDNSGSSSTPYAVIIGTSLAAIATLALGTWFARRHWLKRCS